LRSALQGREIVEWREGTVELLERGEHAVGTHQPDPWPEGLAATPIGEGLK
jgi:hypothetical protein